MRYSPTKTGDSNRDEVAAQMRPVWNCIRTGNKIPTDDVSSLAAGMLFATQAARDPDLQEYQLAIRERMKEASKRFVELKNASITADELTKEAMKIAKDRPWFEPTGEKKALNALAPLFTSMHDDRPARSRLLMKRGFELASSVISTRTCDPIDLKSLARHHERSGDDRGAKDALNSGDSVWLDSIRGSAPALISLADRIGTNDS